MLKMLGDFFKIVAFWEYLNFMYLGIWFWLKGTNMYQEVSENWVHSTMYRLSLSLSRPYMHMKWVCLVSTMCCYGYSIGFFSWLAQFQEPFGSRVTRSSAWEQNKKTSIIVVASNSHTWVLGVVYTFWAFLSSTSIIFVVFLFFCCHGLVVNFHVSYKVFCKDFRASGLLGWTRKAWKSLVFGGIF